VNHEFVEHDDDGASNHGEVPSGVNLHRGVSNVFRQVSFAIKGKFVDSDGSDG
jgi:hypothetical protein